MRKTLLFSVALLLTLTLPIVFAKPHYYYPTVTFAGDLGEVGEEEILEAWPEPPSSKIVIEWEPIDLTFQDRGTVREASDLYKPPHDWDYFEDLSQNWPRPCKLYLRVFKHKGKAMIEYYFGEKNDNFQFVLKGSGTWSQSGNTDVISCSGEFTIYDLSWIGNKGWKIKYDQRWTGSLSFTIEIEVV